MNLHFVPNWAVHEVPFSKTQANLSNSTRYELDKSTEELTWKNGQLSLQVMSPPPSPATGLPQKEHDKQVDKTFDSNVNQEDTTPVMAKLPVEEEPTFHEPEPATIKIRIPTPAASLTGKHPGGVCEDEKKPEAEAEKISIANKNSLQVRCSDLASVIGQAVSEVVGSCSVMPGRRGRRNNKRRRYVSDSEEKDTATSIFLEYSKLEESESESDPNITAPKVQKKKKKLKVNGRSSSTMTKQSRSPPSSSNRRIRRNKMKRKMKILESQRDELEASRLEELVEQLRQLDAQFRAHAIAMQTRAKMAAASSMMMMMMPMIMNMQGMMPLPAALFNPNPTFFMPHFPFAPAPAYQYPQHQQTQTPPPPPPPYARP